MAMITKKPVKYFVVDAFTESAFKGNQAAVCMLEEENERDEACVQSLAAEFNVSETCFVTLLTDARFRLRWFTPSVEVDLCGHGTLASAHAIFSNGLVDVDRVKTVKLETRSGILTARKKMSSLLERALPFILVVAWQIGLGGMDILTKVVLNDGMSVYVLVVYRHGIAAICMAPFAYYLDRALGAGVKYVADFISS